MNGKYIIQAIVDWAEEADTHVTLLGDEEDRHLYAPAIVGVLEMPRPAVVYDEDKVVRCLMKMNKWTWDEAREWFDFNTERAVGYLSPQDNPPVFIKGINCLG